MTRMDPIGEDACLFFLEDSKDKTFPSRTCRNIASLIIHARSTRAGQCLQSRWATCSERTAAFLRATQTECSTTNSIAYQTPKPSAQTALFWRRCNFKSGMERWQICVQFTQRLQGQLDISFFLPSFFSVLRLDLTENRVHESWWGRN